MQMHPSFDSSKSLRGKNDENRQSVANRDRMAQSAMTTRLSTSKRSDLVVQDQVASMTNKQKLNAVSEQADNLDDYIRLH